MPSTKHPIMSLIYIAMLKITISLTYIRNPKMICDFLQLAKGIFSELCCYGYKIYCIVGFSLCKEQECKKLCLEILWKVHKSKFFYVD